MHRWDAEPRPAAEPIETKLAADGVSEVLDTWLPAGRRQGPTELQGVVHLRRHRRRPGVVRPAARRGRGPARHRHASWTPTTTTPGSHAAGTASDLLLALYGPGPASTIASVVDRRR